MNDKKQMLTMLKAEFKRWEDLLADLSEVQINVPLLPAALSIKDNIAHLMAWQQVSIARLEAAQRNQEPMMPDWLAGLDPESEEDREQFNLTIYATYHSQPWTQVQRLWRDGFLRFLKLGAAIPEDDLMDTTKFPWLKGYALFAVLEGSHGHHQEHLEELPALLQQHG